MTKPNNTESLSPNDLRATWASLAVKAFVDEVATDAEDVLCDLLCDLMHWASRNGLDFTAELARASQHHEFEVAEEA